VKVLATDDVCEIGDKIAQMDHATG